MSDQDDGAILSDDGNDLMKISELSVEAQTIMVSLYNLRSSIKNIENNVRHYERETIKFIRHLRKNQKSRVVKKGGEGEKKEREPSGFAKKTKIKPALMDFFKRTDVQEIIDTIISEEETKPESKFEPVDEDGMINRPSATKIINRYIKNNNLVAKYDGQVIEPDKVLKTLLLPLEAVDKKKEKDLTDLQKKKGYTFLNLQKYIKHLFI